MSIQFSFIGVIICIILQQKQSQMIFNFALLLIQFFDPCNWLTRLPCQTVPNMGGKVVRNERRPSDQYLLVLEIIQVSISYACKGTSYNSSIFSKFVAYWSRSYPWFLTKSNSVKPRISLTSGPSKDPR